MNILNLSDDILSIVIYKITNIRYTNNYNKLIKYPFEDVPDTKKPKAPDCTKLSSVGLKYKVVPKA